MNKITIGRFCILAALLSSGMPLHAARDRETYRIRAEVSNANLRVSMNNKFIGVTEVQTKLQEVHQQGRLATILIVITPAVTVETLLEILSTVQKIGFTRVQCFVELPLRGEMAVTREIVVKPEAEEKVQIITPLVR